jgi:hypothetical protein
MQNGADEVSAINFVKDSEDELLEVTPLNTKIIARDQREAKTRWYCIYLMLTSLNEHFPNSTHKM